MGYLSSPAFWGALGSIVLANIVLSGDNAVVIAMAARSLPRAQQRRAAIWGSAAAIVMRIGLTLVAVELLRWPYLKIVGSLLLLWIGVTLLRGDAEPEGAPPNRGMLAAIRTILVADLVMSLDNVLAVAAAARGDIPLLVLGLVISIPLIVFGSTLLSGLMARFPIIVTLGAALLGFLAGEMAMSDPALTARVGEPPDEAVDGVGVAGAALVVGVGQWWRKRREAATA
ncbi:MAG: TerC family protein [Proteobacteria bacterium]|nr:TerC family protein [Pseudomonadota bacterium]